MRSFLLLCNSISSLNYTCMSSNVFIISFNCVFLVFIKPFVYKVLEYIHNYYFEVPALCFNSTLFSGLLLTSARQQACCLGCICLSVFVVGSRYLELWCLKYFLFFAWISDLFFGWWMFCFFGWYGQLWAFCLAKCGCCVVSEC